MPGTLAVATTRDRLPGGGEPGRVRVVGNCMRFRLALPFLVLAAPLGAAADSKLLEDAVDNWLGERDHWAFTQRAVEYERGQPRERLERYDPSKPGNARWALLAINGQPPTPEQHDAWARKKFKKNKRKFDSPIGDYFEFGGAKVVSENRETVRYEVPLRRDKQWLFETDKVRVFVTVNKQTRALEHLSAELRNEPLKVLFGLAKVWEGVLDLTFDDNGAPGKAGPDAATPTGTAKVSVTKFGERAEFTWSEFKRVTPHPSTITRNDPRPQQ